MNTTIKLSVSSVLLAGFMTGCSQQQFQGGGQQIAGGSQVAGGSQIAGGQQIFGGGQQVAGGQQVMGGQQVRGGGQSAGGQQVMGGQQVLGGQQRQSARVDSQVQSLVMPSGIDAQIQDAVVPSTSHLHNSTVQSNEHAHNVEPLQRVYEPLAKAPAVFQYEKPEPVYYDNEIAAQPVYYEQAAPQAQRPKPMPRQKPVVRHKGIGMPPAHPGQCFAKVNTPAKFKNSVKRVQVSPAVNKRVKVRGPQYTWVTKKVLARPATHRNQYIPAQYRNITKKVLVKPAHYAWQKGKTGPVTRIDNMTGEILCRVKIPAVYRTVTQRVIARPAQRIKRNIPAVYKTIKQKKLASPAVFRTIKTPARFVNKTYRVQTSGARQEWKQIACKAPANAQRAAVQRPKPAVRKHVPARVSPKQRQLAIEYNRQQQVLRQQWIQQEAERKRQASNPRPVQRRHVQHQRPVQQRHVPRNNNAQLQANQQRRAQHAAREQQRLARLAQQRKLAQQARLRQVQIAKQRRMAQHQANQLAQRKAAQMRRLKAGQQPSYAKPKARPAARYAPKPLQHQQVRRPNMAPKARPYQQQRIQAQAKRRAQVQQVVNTPKPRVQQQPRATAAQASGNDNAPLTRANAVFRIQKALMQRGFNPGPVDGKLGPATVKALTAFQETKGLKTGTLNRDTLRALSLVN